MSCNAPCMYFCSCLIPVYAKLYQGEGPPLQQSKLESAQPHSLTSWWLSTQLNIASAGEKDGNGFDIKSPMSNNAPRISSHGDCQCIIGLSTEHQQLQIFMNHPLSNQTRSWDMLEPYSSLYTELSNWNYHPTPHDLN